MIKKSDITTILDRIDARSADEGSVTAEDITASNPSVFSSAFMDTEQGRRFLEALKAYGGSSSFANANSNNKQQQQIQEKRAEQKRQILYYELALDNFIDAVDNYTNAATTQVNTASATIAQAAIFNSTSKALLKTTVGDPQFENEEDQERLNNVDRLSIKLDQFIERSDNIVTTALLAIKDVKAAKNSMLGACTPATANTSECEIEREKLNQNLEILDKAMDGVTDMVNEVADLSQGIVDEMTAIFEGKDPSPEQEELLQRLNTQNAEIQNLHAKFSQGNLTLDEYENQLNQAKNAFENITDAIITIDVQDPELTQLQDKLLTSRNNLVAGLNIATSKDTLDNLSGLKAQIEEQKERIALLETIEAATSKQHETLNKYADVEGMDRQDFLKEHRSDTGFLNHHVGRNLTGAAIGLWNDITGSEEKAYDKDEYVRMPTKDQEIVFYDNGNYYYFKDEDPNQRIDIDKNDPVLNQIRAEGWADKDAKFFGGDTSYGLEFEGAANNFIKNAAGGEELATTQVYADKDLKATRILITDNKRQLEKLETQANEQQNQTNQNLTPDQQNILDRSNAAQAELDTELNDKNYPSYADTVAPINQAENTQQKPSTNTEPPLKAFNNAAQPDQLDQTTPQLASNQQFSIGGA